MPSVDATVVEPTNFNSEQGQISGEATIVPDPSAGGGGDLSYSSPEVTQKS